MERRVRIRGLMGVRQPTETARDGADTVQVRAAALLGRFLRPEALRFLRFASVGCSGVLVNMATLWLLHDELGLPLEPSSIIAISLAIVNNFLWNNFWTFRASHILARRVAQFVTISLVGMAINVSVLKGLVHFGNYYLVANLAGILIATAWNFVANSRWTWGDAK